MTTKDDLWRIGLLADRSEVVPCPVNGLDPMCWVVNWTMPGGYANMAFRGKTWLVHRAAYVALVAEIPEGLRVDHLCKNRTCWNPAHLDPVTRLVSMRRGNPGRKPTARCPKGHVRTPENTDLVSNSSSKNGFQRQCRVCRDIRRLKT